MASGAGARTRDGGARYEPSGDVDDGARALPSPLARRPSPVDGATARVTIQAHEWNETIGRADGVPSYHRPEQVVRRTDTPTLVGGRWPMARGPLTVVRRLVTLAPSTRSPTQPILPHPGDRRASANISRPDVVEQTSEPVREIVRDMARAGDVA